MCSGFIQSLGFQLVHIIYVIQKNENSKNIYFQCLFLSNMKRHHNMSRYWGRREGVIMKESFCLKRYCHFMSMKVATGKKKQKKAFEKRHQMSTVFRIGRQCKNI
jgi:hypothetical protein